MLTGHGTASPAGDGPSSPVPPNTTTTATGMRTTIIRTRRYCSTATSRLSAPSSSDAATIPAAPPAIIPNVAVVRSTPVAQASRKPARIVSSSVASVIRVTGSQ